MSIREKINRQIDQLTESELQQLSELIQGLKVKSSEDIKSIETSSACKPTLKHRNFGGNLDHVNIRDAAYE